MQCVHVSKTKFEVSNISPEGYLTCFLYIGYINLILEMADVMTRMMG